MHELDVTKELIEQVKNIAKKHNVSSGEIIVELGRLTTFVSEPIYFYFEQLTKDDKFFSNKNIQLKIEEKDGSLRCNHCGKVSLVSEVYERICPECNSTDTIIEGGNQLMIKSIEKFE